MENNKKVVSILFFAFFLILFILPVHATEGEVNLTDLPTKLSEMLNITLFPAQLLVTGIFMALFLFPTLLLTRNLFAPIAVGICVMGFCVGMGWLPPFILVVVVLLTAMSLGWKFKEIFT